MKINNEDEILFLKDLIFRFVNKYKCIVNFANVYTLLTKLYDTEDIKHTINNYEEFYELFIYIEDKYLIYFRLTYSNYIIMNYVEEVPQLRSYRG